MKLRVLVTMYAEVDTEVYQHPDGGGAAIQPTIDNEKLVINYSGHDLPEELSADARAAITTVCAHMMASMGSARLARRLAAGPSANSDGPTQPPGEA